ncbi:MAG: TetR/AcrR family transcriptional regulator, partial [Microthrixaceae bacterium]
NRAVGNAYFRDEVAAVFAAELELAPVGTLEAVDALSSWEIWERLRTFQGLSVPEAGAVIEGMLLATLGSYSS